MQKSTNTLKPYAFIAISSLIVLLSLTFLFKAFLTSLITSAFNGQSFDYLNTLVLRNKLKDPLNRDLRYYQNLIIDLVLRLQILIVCGSGLIYYLLKRKEVILSELSKAHHGINISVLRIAVYANCLLFSNSLILDTSNLPAGTHIPPLGWSWFASFFPNQNLAIVMLIIFKIICLFGLVGFGGRMIHIAASITGLFLLAIPQLYGKIDHYHHIWLALTALIFTYPNEYLSIDKKLNKSSPLNNHLTYTQTINFVILLIGMIYFFPGIWKFLLGGIEWASAQNMTAKLYNSWIEKDFSPLFRVDQYPALVTMGGMTTLFFEILFIFFVFDPILKWIFIALAVFFHVSTFFFMNIAFFDLLMLFVVFIRWEKVMSVDEIEVKRIKNPLNIFGLLVLSSFILCGLSLIDTWPFAAYPTFASKEKNEITTVTLKYSDLNGDHAISLGHSRLLLQSFHDHARLKSYLNRFVFESNLEKLDRFSTSVLQILDPTRSFQNVKFYTDRLSSIPEDQGKIIERKLLLTKDHY